MEGGDEEVRWSGASAARPDARDPDVARVRAQLEARLLGAVAAPVTIGRFALLERVAAGSMGVVFAAYDRDLDRKVALKLLHRDLGTAVDRARMVREGKAMAKLSHPNVAQIYDVGEHDGRTFIAMELAIGRTLRAWQLEAPRSVAEILAVYGQAGRGLAAIHAAGLVHRDFKPDNAIVGADGRVRVVDLGLARVDDETRAEASVEDGTMTSSRTSQGLAGSPAYMAPEQLACAQIDARADQFALCVSLWEALHGRRPFAGADPEALARAIEQGEIDAEPSKSPAWIDVILRRGLAHRVADRYPSIDALLDALADDPSARRRRAFVAGGVVLVVAAVGVGFGLDRAATRRECDERAASIAAIWNDDAREAVRTGLLATGAAYAPATWERVGDGFDRWTTEWSAVRVRSCLAVADPQAEACLDEGRDAFATMVESFADADATVVQGATRAVAALPPPASCVDDPRWARRPLPPADDRETVATLRRDLARARGLEAAARYGPADELAVEIVAKADALGWAPLQAEALVVHGGLQARRSELVPAEESLERAVGLAMRSRADDLAIDAISQLVYTTGHLRARHERGVWWATLGLDLAARLGDEDDLRTAMLVDRLAMVRLAAGEHDEARAALERALTTQERLLGTEHPDLTVTLDNLGRVHLALADPKSALALFERSLAISELALGADHPGLAATLNNIGEAHRALGDHARALPYYERALAIMVAAHGEMHLSVAQISVNIGLVHYADADFDRAEAMTMRALAIREELLGPKHPEVAAISTNLGGFHFSQGDYAGAAKHFERALAILESTLGADHPQIADASSNLGAVKFELGHLAEAKALSERALAIRESALGPDHPDVATSLDALGNIHNNLGEPDEAQPLLERALAIRERALDPDDVEIAGSLINLGIIHHERGDDSRARELYERAAVIWETARGPDHPGLAMIHNNLGNVLFELGEPAQARAAFERAREIWGGASGADHPDVATALDNLGMVHRKLGEYADARVLYERALAILEKKHGPDHVELADPLAGLVECALAEQRRDEAIALAERALRLCEAGEVAPQTLDKARARLATARALPQKR